MIQKLNRIAAGCPSVPIIGRSRGFRGAIASMGRFLYIAGRSPERCRSHCGTIIRHLLPVLLLAGVSPAVSAQGSVFSDGFESGDTCAWSHMVPLMVFFQDLDGDGFGNPDVSQEGCEAPSGFVADNTDCDDSSEVTYPGAAPLDSPALCMKDFDTDDYGDDNAGPFTPGTDCDDTNVFVNPDAVDVCDDVDNNCDGTPDEAFLPGGSVVYDGGPYPPDAGTAKNDFCGTGNCAGGIVVCGFDMLSLTCSTLVLIDTEVCDGVDNDCDGDIDEGVTNACGGCDVLPANPGEPCGTCGEWECLGIDDVMCVDPCILVDFGPVPSFVRLGQMAVTTIPDPLLVTLAGSANDDTFVTITSNDLTSLGVVGGGVTVSQGTSSAAVLLDGLQQSSAVTLTASLAAVSLEADVRVIGGSEQPQVAAITPAVVSVPMLGSVFLDVWLDIPAGPAGTVVDLSLSPGTFGSVPSIVEVPADNLSAAVKFSAGASIGTELLTASLGASTANATIDVISEGGLVINEVDYDQEGIDTLEFIEIYNSGAASINLTNLSLVLVNGSISGEYDRISLAPVSTLAAGEYLVIGSIDLLATVPTAAKTIAFDEATSNIQNGSPDGLAIIDEVAVTLIDALSYEGEITAAFITGLGTGNRVEGPATPASDPGIGSLIRFPNGIDADDAASDWAYTLSVTPGATNVP